ncbi:MAG: excinuclease ABC subunit UvrC [Candidatus Aminicenantes bacterium]|nr:excinuclease ABC subunit UvrC [Candidatus Aminicenantes bacterium]
MLKNRKDLPEKPGIYIFKTAAGKTLYIGKAINLKKRVGQYFQKRDNPLLQNLLQRAADIDYVVTAAEDDALLLEANLVHSYQPPFNIRLKDDKSFPFIEITLNENFPGIYFSRRVAAGNYGLGPLVSSQKARDLIDTVTRLFRLRSCAASTFKKGVPCLYFHIDRCSAPCAGRIDPRHYRQQVLDAVDFLKGHKRKVAVALAQRMSRYAEALDFEHAQKIKQDLELIESFSPRSCISTRARGDCDILVASSLGDEAFFAYFAVVGGQVRKSEYFNLPAIDSGEDEVLKGFLLDFYQRRPLPGEIIVARLPGHAQALEKLFSDQAGRRVRIRTVRQGRKKRILELAWQNLALFIQKSDYRLLAEKIRQQLGLRNFPAFIEGYDISHLGEKNRVGARVVFKNGRPEKRSYRSYLIRGAGGGDTGALKEVLSRRFASETDQPHRVDPPDDFNAAEKRLKSWREQPDLLLIDGGRPQMAAARQVKEKLRLRSDLLALAKGEERIFMEDGSSLVLAPGSPAKFLFQNIRDEVHRRAITHHRRRRDVLSRGRREKLPG